MWIFQGCQSYYGIHGYSDTRELFPWIIQGCQSNLTSADTLTQGWGCRAVMHGLSRDVRVTLTSGETLTQGWRGRAVVRITLTSGCLTRQSKYLWIIGFHSGHWTLHGITGLCFIF